MNELFSPTGLASKVLLFRLWRIERACSVKVWCTKIARILRIVVQTGANLAVWSGK